MTTLPTGAADNFVATRFYVDVHATDASSAAISCGDLNVKPPKPAKSAAMTFLKGASSERGRAELFQKGGDVTVWISLSGLTPGAHAVHLHVGSCGEPRRRRRQPR